jgi:hypothetical protein
MVPRKCPNARKSPDAGGKATACPTGADILRRFLECGRIEASPAPRSIECYRLRLEGARQTTAAVLPIGLLGHAQGRGRRGDFRQRPAPGTALWDDASAPARCCRRANRNSRTLHREEGFRRWCLLAEPLPPLLELVMPQGQRGPLTGLPLLGFSAMARRP